MHKPLDTSDTDILRVLQQNARASLSDIGKEVSLSLPAVSQRVRKLEQSGLIRQYTTLLDEKKLGKSVCCYCLLVLRKTLPADDASFTDFIQNEREILACHCISGDYEFLLHIVTDSTDTLEALLVRLRKAVSVLRTNTILVLSSIKNDVTITV